MNKITGEDFFCNKYKLYSADEVLAYAKEHNISTTESGYDVTPSIRSIFRQDKEDEKIIDQGFLYVDDEDDASHLGGPFLHHFGFVCVTFHSNPDKLMSIEESIRDNFRWQMEHFKQYDHIGRFAITLDQHIVAPTKENPYVIYICGNDDFSWTKTADTENKAKRCLWDLYLCSSKIKYGGFKRALKDGMFTFTN